MWKMASALCLPDARSEHCATLIFDEHANVLLDARCDRVRVISKGGKEALLSGNRASVTILKSDEKIIIGQWNLSIVHASKPCMLWIIAKRNRENRVVTTRTLFLGTRIEISTEQSSTSAKSSRKVVEEKLFKAKQNFNSGNFNAAERLCREVVVESPVNAQAVYFLAVVLQTCTKDTFFEVESLYRRAMRIDPSFTIRCLGNLAALLHRIPERVCEADAMYRRILRSDPDNRVALFNLADILTRSNNRSAEAAACYRKLLLAHPKHDAAAIGLADILRLDKNFSNDAEVLYREVAERGSSRYAGGATVAVANLLVERSECGTEEIAEAERMYRRALSLEPNRVANKLALANYLMHFGNATHENEAEKLLRDVLRTNEQNTFALSCLVRLIRRRRGVVDPSQDAPSSAPSFLARFFRAFICANTQSSAVCFDKSKRRTKFEEAALYCRLRDIVGDDCARKALSRPTPRVLW